MSTLKIFRKPVRNTTLRTGVVIQELRDGSIRRNDGTIIIKQREN